MNQHQISAEETITNRGISEEDQTPETRATQQHHCSKQTHTSTSSASSSPPRDFSFTDRPCNGWSSVEMAPADKIFFHGHILPLRLLSHFPTYSLSSPRLLTEDEDDPDSFTLPIEKFFPDDHTGARTPESSRTSSSVINFRAKFGNRIHSEATTHHVTLSNEMGGRGEKSKLSSLFGLSRRRRAGESQVDEGDADRQERSFFRHAVKKYVKMAGLLIFGRRRRTRRSEENNVKFEDGMGDLVGTKMYSAPASIMTSPRNSGLLVSRPGSCGTVADSSVEELQAAIQAAIAYCKKSIAAEEEEGKVRT